MTKDLVSCSSVCTESYFPTTHTELTENLTDWGHSGPASIGKALWVSYKGINGPKECEACASFLLVPTRSWCQVQLFVVPTWKAAVARFSCLLFWFWIFFFFFSKQWLVVFISCTNKRLGAFRPGNKPHSMIQWLHAGRSLSLQSFCLPAAPWDYLTLTIMEPYEDMVDYEEKYT